MNSVTFKTGASRRQPWAQGLGLATTVVTAWALSAGTAQARGDDVYWSVGVGSPGVSVGVSNVPPPRVVVQPAPVVVHQPAPVVIHQPYPYPYPYVRPVVVQPRTVVYRGWGPHDGHRHERRHWKQRHHDRHDHHDRYEHDDRWDDDRRR
jgi:hypothetical protein